MNTSSAMKQRRAVIFRPCCGSAMMARGVVTFYPQLCCSAGGSAADRPDIQTADVGKQTKNVSEKVGCASAKH